ncbi:Flagellar assembly factor FliW [Planctomycetales bacterium 10988]|nr:Flagellar assembly factor FliW [Planctomycetales bacterium 10988]
MEAESHLLTIASTRFGELQLEEDDLLYFPDGLLGLESCQRWILLIDWDHAACGWLQSATVPEIALAVVSPRRFVPDYQIRTTPAELQSLQLENLTEAQVLVIVGKNSCGQTLNLKAPLILNPTHRLGRQIIAKGDLPVRYVLPLSPTQLLKLAS